MVIAFSDNDDNGTVSKIISEQRHHGSENEASKGKHPLEQSTTTESISTPSREQQRDVVVDHHNNVLRSFPLFGWIPDPDLCDDENYMDLIMILTRSSICRQGCMACILVQPQPPKQQDDDQPTPSEDNNHPNGSSSKSSTSSRICSAIIAASTNQPLYSEMDSDVHAEVGALGQAARHGRATEGCTAYITMPPCTRCFAALTVSGIARIVTRRSNFHPDVRTAAAQRNLELVDISSTEVPRQARIQQLVAAAATTPTSHSNTNGAQGNVNTTNLDEQQQRIVEQRKRKKEEKQTRKQKKLSQLGNA